MNTKQMSRQSSTISAGVKNKSHELSDGTGVSIEFDLSEGL